MEIRRATPEDAEAISTLIKSVAHYFTLHPQGLGAEAFLQSIEPEAIQGYITAPNFLYPRFSWRFRSGDAASARVER